MLSKNFYKSGWVAVRDDDTRVIDTNELAEQKIQSLVNAMEEERRRTQSSVGVDGFSEGLNAQHIDVLADEDGADAVLNAERQREAEALSEQIRAAREELEQIELQAQQTMQNAQAEIEKAMQEAVREGQAQGYAEGQKQAAAEADKVMREYENKSRRLDTEYQKKIDELEPQFIDLLTAIYERVFQTDLQNHKMIVTHLIGRAIRKIEGGRDFLIHVSKDEYSFVSTQKKELLEGISSSQTTVEIIEDITLAQGQCFIETEGGIFDCGLDTQLTELGNKLKLLSFEA